MKLQQDEFFRNHCFAEPLERHQLRLTCIRFIIFERQTHLNEAIMPSDVDVNRISFFIWFFGASGGAGIARSAFPRMYNSVRYVQNLKGVGPTLGGPTIGLSPLCGYPEDISVADVQKIVNSKLSIEQIVAK